MLKLKSDATVVWMGTTENKRVCQLPELVSCDSDPGTSQTAITFSCSSTVDSSSAGYLGPFVTEGWRHGCTQLRLVVCSWEPSPRSSPSPRIYSDTQSWHCSLFLSPSLSDCCSYIYPAAHWFQVCQQLRAQPISGHLILSLQGSGSLVTNCSCTSGLTEADRLRVSSDKTLTRLCSL